MSIVKNIELNFIYNLRKNGFDVAPNAVCRINENAIELGIAPNEEYAKKGHKMAFASNIELYSSNSKFFGERENEINFGSSGSFNPKVKESYWRTIHAASILKNWDLACVIINDHCQMYSDIISKK